MYTTKNSFLNKIMEKELKIKTKQCQEIVLVKIMIVIILNNLRYI